MANERPKKKYTTPVREVKGRLIQANNTGDEFFHRHLSDKAMSRKKKNRKNKKASRRRNRN